MLKDLFSNKRVLFLLTVVTLLSLILLSLLVRVGNRVSNDLAATKQASTAQALPSPTTRPPLPTLAPANTPLPTPVDWKTLGVNECNEPFTEFYQSLGLEFPIGSGVWVSDSPCMGWWEVPFYQDGTLVAQDVVFTAVIEQEWVMARQPDDYQLILTDDTILHGENKIEAGQAIWTTYNLRTLERLTVTLDQNSDVQITTAPIAVEDVISSLGPDNPCNWPHTISFIREFLTVFPDSDYVWTMDAWEELKGCDVGYSFIVSNSNLLLIVSQDGAVRTTQIEGLEHNWLQAADNSGNLFYTSFPEFVTITSENTAVIEKGRQELFYRISDITIGLADTNHAYDLYQKAAQVIPEGASEFSPRGYQRPKTEAGDETANIYSFIFQAEGMWHTAVIIMDFETGFYGPVLIDNIREFSSWQTIDATHIAGYYSDGSSINLSLNADGTLTITQ